MSRPDDLEVNDHTDWWVAFHAEGDEPIPIAFARTTEELHAAVVRAFIARGDTKRDAEMLASRDIVHARCALRVAWRNNFEHDRDAPQVEWLDARE